jgi:hypothetical protein
MSLSNIDLNQQFEINEDSPFLQYRKSTEFIVFQLLPT